MKPNTLILFVIVLLAGCQTENPKQQLAHQIQQDSTFAFVRQKAVDIMKTGFNAGDGYSEVWIRDFNTFIDLALDVHPQEDIRENLLVFFRMQGNDGNIIDGFVPRDKATAGYDYITTELEPRYAGHKNSVETDQETSLIQAVYKYVKKTGDTAFLREPAGDFTVAQRMEKALNYLMTDRYNKQYGLIYGATTADWGDVQPEGGWGVDIDENTHFAIDIYDNAMLVIALKDFIGMLPDKAAQWQPVLQKISDNTMKYLWDEKLQKFIPHLYLNGSPFPPSLDENKIFYYGGTATAIEAGLLSKEQIKASLEQMIAGVKDAGAASIGLTLYPPYPEGAFRNKGMGPYSYQNGGDWTWFGGRMIQQLIRYGFVQEAYQQIQPMVERVKANDGFYEWYTVDNQPKGSGTFRGSAGVLYQAIEMFDDWANQQQK